MDSETVVLVAEDEDGHFALIRKNLQRSGLENNIVRFTDGQQLFDYLQVNNQKNRYVLLLDLRMPKMNGFEVLRQLKSDNHFRKIPVLVLTTASTTQDIELCHELGCALYIAKPVEYEAFVEAIRRIGAFLKVIEVPVAK